MSSVIPSIAPDSATTADASSASANLQPTSDLAQAIGAAVLTNDQAAAEYSDAQQITADAPQAPFVLPAYTGGVDDLAYLKQWVLNAVTSIYGVSASLFDTPTLLSTSILRDFVHRAVYQNTNPDSEPNEMPGFISWADVALEFRTGARGLCGDLAWQEFEVFRAFGYQAQEISTANGPVGDWTDGHVTTQVYLSDLGKFVVQDSTYNFVYNDSQDDFLSFDQARQHDQIGDLSFNGFQDYRWYNTEGAPEDGVNSDLQTYLEANYLSVPYWVYDPDGSQVELVNNLYPDASSPHDAATNEGGEFASASSASQSIAALAAQSMDWTAAAAQLRAEGFYVSGFALPNAGASTGEQWLSVRLQDGSYVSFQYGGAGQLNGALDQIESEATGGTSLNPGVDLSPFLSGVYALAANGQLMNQSTEALTQDLNASGRSDILIENSNGAVVVGEVGPNGTELYSQVAGVGPEWSFVGTGDFTGEGHAQFLLENTNGVVAIGDVQAGAAQFTAVSALGAAWSFAGTGDFLGDGQTQFLIENTNGAVDLGEVSSNGKVAYSKIGALGPEWSFIGTGNFLGLGADQFVLENTNGTLDLGQVESGAAVYTQIGGLGPEWTIAGAGDFLNNGVTDLLIENTNGAIDVGEIGSDGLLAWTQVGGLGAEWKFVGAGDFMGLGFDQFLIEKSSGAVVVGEVKAGQAQYATIAAFGPEWLFRG